MHSGIGVSNKDTISLTVISDKERYNIQLDAADRNPTVQQLAEQISDITKIPAANQRLICKGRSLTNFTATLDSYGVRSGAKIMMIVSKSDQSENDGVDQDDRAKVMTSVDKVVSEHSSKLDELQKQFTDIDVGYLSADLRDEAINRLRRQVAGCIEMLTKQLERLDGLSLADSTDELKTRRKTTVKRIQTILDTADKLMNDIKSFLSQNTPA